MSTKHENTGGTIPFEEFDAIYRAHLADPDQPSCYVAYVRAEAEVEKRTGARRWRNYPTFISARTRHRRKNTADAPEKNAVNISGVPIKCQICSTELYRVPRGDIRTLIPQTCRECIAEMKKLILG